MKPIQNPQRFEVNPIEVIILFATFGILAHSAYNLLYNYQGFHPTLLAPRTLNSRTTADADRLMNPSAQRGLASSQAQTLSTYAVSCDKEVSTQTGSSKLRLNGSVCNPQAGSEQEPSLTKVSVSNQTNHFQATVFMSREGDQYSTDYIPISPGENSIRIETTGRNTPADLQTLRVIRDLKE